MRSRSAFILMFFMLFAATSALAIPTHITVRVISKDAKFIGTGMQGVSVTIRDVETGGLLAEGVTAGETGNTDHIMKEPRARKVPLSDDKSAKFEATIDLDEPRLIQVTAYGPLSQRQSANSVSATQWVVPAKHINAGDAWIMELPGFAVKVLSPSANVELKGTPQEVEIKAHITMMCGCPLNPGGLWDSSKYEIMALLMKNGKSTAVLELNYAGEPSRFSGLLKVNDPGTYQAIVYAYDPSNGNTGLDRVTFLVK